MSAGFGNALTLGGMFLGFAGSQSAAEAEELAGRWNKEVSSRNASLLRYAAEETLLQSKLDILDFQSQYQAFEKETEAALFKTGADAYSGTALQILLDNAEQADENIRRIDFAARATSRDIREKATAASLRGDIAMFEANASAQATRTAAMATLLSQGSSFVKGGGASKEGWKF